MSDISWLYLFTLNFCLHLSFLQGTSVPYLYACEHKSVGKGTGKSSEGVPRCSHSLG